VTAAEVLAWASRFRQAPREHPLAAAAAGAAARFSAFGAEEKPFHEPLVWAPFVFLGA